MTGLANDIYDNKNWTLPQVLANATSTHPDRTCAVSVDGERLSYRELEAQSSRVANFLSNLGVAPGDRVVVMEAGGCNFLRIWAGLARLGAIMVALNPELSGSMLESQARRSGAKVALLSDRCIGPFSEALAEASGSPNFKLIVRVSSVGSLDPNVSKSAASKIIDFDGWRKAAAYDGPTPKPSDIACILYTSGTTGPSKGVLLPHAHCYLYGLGAVDCCALTPDDVNYVVLPLYHVNGLFIQIYGCLITGATVVLREKFSASQWWDDILKYKATLTCSVAAITSFVFAQPERADEAQHQLRLIMVGPNVPEQEKVWRERYKVPVVMSCYGMTECNMVTWERIDETRSGSVGRAYSRYYEVQIVDPETDEELPRGTAGELVVRPKAPFAFMAGYDGMPDRTVEAMRNLWFHTGDAAVMDKDGFVFFLDRMKDRIRRRGENVSSFEVEDAVRSFAGVEEVAAFAVPSEIVGAEDEIMVAVVLNPPDSISIQALAVKVHSKLPRFARPRFFEIVEQLPKTKTHKIQKGVLRERGVNRTTWDAQLEKFAG